MILKYTKWLAYYALGFCVIVMLILLIVNYKDMYEYSYANYTINDTREDLNGKMIDMSNSEEYWRYYYERNAVYINIQGQSYLTSKELKDVILEKCYCGG